MNEHISKVLFSEKQIQSRVRELGAEIKRDYAGKSPVLIGVLKGCFIFMADLIRSIDLPLAVDFMVVSSYGEDTRSSGIVKIIKDLSSPIEGKDVIIVEDILDSGYTLSYLREYLGCQSPASIKIVTLLDKPDRRKVKVVPDYVGFRCPNEFIVGYGLDKAELWRNLPYIGVVESDVSSLES